LGLQRQCRVGVTEDTAQLKLLDNKVIKEVYKIQSLCRIAILPSITEAEALKTGGAVVTTTLKISIEDFRIDS